MWRSPSFCLVFGTVPDDARLVDAPLRFIVDTSGSFQQTRRDINVGAFSFLMPLVLAVRLQIVCLPPAH